MNDQPSLFGPESASSLGEARPLEVANQGDAPRKRATGSLGATASILANLPEAGLPDSAHLEPEQSALFDKGQWWHEHWKGMPAFVQNDCMPFKTVMVHFETRANMEAFSRLIRQQVLTTTPSIWYPEATIQHWDKKWVDKTHPESDGDSEMLDEG